MAPHTTRYRCGTFNVNRAGLFSRLRSMALSHNESAYDEVAILAKHKSTTPTVPQHIPFTDLPGEIRNYIYELALPSRESQLIVATPAYDDLMLFGDQPALTKASRQLRSETLGLFYANTTFVAYIENLDFTNLIRWAKCITSASSPPAVRIEVKLMGRMHYAYQLMDLVRAWRDVDSENIHLTIHDYRAVSGFALFIAKLDQRELVERAIGVAEALRLKGDFTEAGLITTCYEAFEKLDCKCLGSEAIGVNQSCVWAGKGSYHGNNVAREAFGEELLF